MINFDEETVGTNLAYFSYFNLKLDLAHSIDAYKLLTCSILSALRAQIKEMPLELKEFQCNGGASGRYLYQTEFEKCLS